MNLLFFTLLWCGAIFPDYFRSYNFRISIFNNFTFFNKYYYIYVCKILWFRVCNSYTNSNLDGV